MRSRHPAIMQMKTTAPPHETRFRPTHAFPNPQFGNEAKTTIVAFILATLLSGCGVKKEDHQKAVNELAQAKQQREEAKQEASDLKSALAEANTNKSKLETRLQDANARVTAMATELDHLKKQDSYAFREAGTRVDAGDLTGALQAYKAFVRAFPSSPQVSAATSQIQQIEQRLESQRREAAAREIRERQELAQREFAERLRSGALTPLEWAPILRNKSMNDIKQLLGVPNLSNRDGYDWVYFKKFRNPLSGSVAFLVIYFDDDGKVASFSEEFTGTKIRP